MRGLGVLPACSYSMARVEACRVDLGVYTCHHTKYVCGTHPLHLDLLPPIRRVRSSVAST